MLFIPGWAADHRIFGSADIRANCLMCVKFSPFYFEEGLIDAIDRYAIKKISIIGWSMGGFIACGLLSKFKDLVDDITLIGVREKYAMDEIENTRAYIGKNRAAFLYKFYNGCFSPREGKELSWFKKELMKSYLNDMGEQALYEGLDYLAATQIRPQLLKGARVRFIHGKEDRIAPIQEARSLRDDLPGSEMIAVEDAGHMPFLKNGFWELLW